MKATDYRYVTEQDRLFLELGLVVLPDFYPKRKTTPDPSEEEILATLKNRAEVRRKLGFPATP